MDIIGMVPAVSLTRRGSEMEMERRQSVEGVRNDY